MKSLVGSVESRKSPLCMINGSQTDRVGSGSSRWPPLKTLAAASQSLMESISTVVAFAWTTPSPTGLMPLRRVNTWDTVAPQTVILTRAVVVEVGATRVTHVGMTIATLTVTVGTTVIHTPPAAALKTGTHTAVIIATAGTGVNAEAHPLPEVVVTLPNTGGVGVTPEAPLHAVQAPSELLVSTTLLLLPHSP